MESEAAVAELSAGEQTLHITLSGLKAQTVYYFIITATNTVGSSRSEVESFETSKDTTGIYHIMCIQSFHFLIHWNKNSIVCMKESMLAMKATGITLQYLHCLSSQQVRVRGRLEGRIMVG